MGRLGQRRPRDTVELPQREPSSGFPGLKIHDCSSIGTLYQRYTFGKIVSRRMSPASKKTASRDEYIPAN